MQQQGKSTTKRHSMSQVTPSEMSREMQKQEDVVADDVNHTNDGWCDADVYSL
jgi:hypothetical protein